MKKATTDAKKVAANDKENGNGKATKAVKRSKPAADEKYPIGSIDTVNVFLRAAD
jgi:hypothetical protein